MAEIIERRQLRTCGASEHPESVPQWRVLPRVIVIWLPDPQRGAATLDAALALAEVLGARAVVTHLGDGGPGGSQHMIESAIDAACRRTGARLPIDTRPVVDCSELALQAAIHLERADLVVAAGGAATVTGPDRAGFRSPAEVAAAAAACCGVPILVVPPQAPTLIDLAEARRRVSSSLGG